MHYIVFAQMLSGTACHWRKGEAIALLQQAGLRDTECTWANEVSWSVIGSKPIAPRPA